MSALVGVIMGSKSDWSTLSHTADMLDKLGIPYEVKVVSAHRTRTCSSSTPRKPKAAASK